MITWAVDGSIAAVIFPQKHGLIWFLIWKKKNRQNFKNKHNKQKSVMMQVDLKTTCLESGTKMCHNKENKHPT